MISQLRDRFGRLMMISHNMIVLGMMIILSLCHLSAVVADYSFSQNTSQYTELNNPTVVMQGNQDDVMTQLIDIGFHFIYDDVLYDQFKINSNGFITLDPQSTTSYQNTLYYSPLIIAGFWDDLQTNGTTGSISYQISGSEPYRIITVQFKNMNWYYNEPGNLINFQICLHETSNAIKFFYGTMGNQPGSYGSAAIGISGVSTGDYISVQPASPTATASSTLEFISINGTHIPHMHEVSYSFTPPSAPPNDLQAMRIFGEQIPEHGLPTEYTFRIRNRGTLPQNDYILKIMDGPLQLVSQPGPALLAGEVSDVTMICAFTTIGPTDIHGEIVFAADQNMANNITPPFHVIVQAAGSETVTIGAGDLHNRIPLDFYWKNNLFECIYLSSEINLTGLITGIELYNNFSDDLSIGKPTKIWLGETTAMDMSGGWIPSTELTQVFDGLVSYPIGINNILITLDTAFPYMGANLILMVQRPMDTEYYNANNYFSCQYIENAARSLKVWSDSYLFDPAAPPPSTPSGLFPKTSFYIVTQGTGSLSGNVSNQGLPLEGASLEIVGTNLSTHSLANGSYSFPYALQGTYQVTCSKFGFEDQTQTASILPDQATYLNFALQTHPTVVVTGRVTGSDSPNTGMAGVSISLFGILDYHAITDPQGYFVLQNVFSDNAYGYVLVLIGYDTIHGSLTIGSADYDMGTIVMNERANPPAMVQAMETTSQALISWAAPDPTAVDVSESFESEVFPPTNWNQIITNTGAPNSYGVYPTWSRAGILPISGNIHPAHGNWHSVIWWSNEHQDEWLITPQFTCPAEAVLIFNGFIYLGPSDSDLDEHYYVKVSLDDGITWSVLWDSVTAGDGAFSEYNVPFIISLADYAYSSIRIAWHADDPPDNSGMWNIAIIDNIFIGSPFATIRFSEDMLISGSSLSNSSGYIVPDSRTEMYLSKDLISSDMISRSNVRQDTLGRNERALLGYKVWRLMEGQEYEEDIWTSLTPAPIQMTSYQDEDWSYLLGGTYIWAVKAIYSNGIISNAAISNSLVREWQPSGIISGVVTTTAGQPVSGATISASVFSTTTVADGSYFMPMSIGNFTVTCSVAGYAPITIENITILPDQTTICNFTLTVDADDEVSLARTELLGNFPNPFNPHTSIHFSLKDRQRVSIDIYNVKGQHIRTLIDKIRERGTHNALWDGRDMNGRPAASGIYIYHMQCAEYSAVRRMMLCK